MRSGFVVFFLLAFVGTLTSVANAKVLIKDRRTVAQVEIDEGTESEKAPAVGKKAATKYFKKSSKGSANYSGGTSAKHYLAIHLGAFVDSQAYAWGEAEKAEETGNLTMGVSYRMGEWVDSMDLLFRGDFNSYDLDEGRAVKFSLMPVVTFPDATSRFPLYFGGGIGLGVFIKQISEESSLAVDYQLLAGVRFFDLLESTGFFFEVALKNHIHILSDGQFNGITVALGSVFTF